jgi:hypothetical protein
MNVEGMPINYRVRGRTGTATAAGPRPLDGAARVVIRYLASATAHWRVPGVSLAHFYGTQFLLSDFFN